MAKGDDITSPQIDEYIREHYPRHTAEYIGKQLGLSRRFVSNRAVQLGVRKNKLRSDCAMAKPVDMKPVWRPKVIVEGAVLRHIAY